MSAGVLTIQAPATQWSSPAFVESKVDRSLEILAGVTQACRLGLLLEGLRLSLRSDSLATYVAGDYSMADPEVVKRLRDEALAMLPRLRNSPEQLGAGLDRLIDALAMSHGARSSANEHIAQDAFVNHEQILKGTSVATADWNSLAGIRARLNQRGMLLARGQVPPLGDVAPDKVAAAKARLEELLTSPTWRGSLVARLSRDVEFLTAVFIDRALRDGHHWAIAKDALAPFVEASGLDPNAPATLEALLQVASGSVLSAAASDAREHVHAVYRMVRPLLQALAAQKADVYGAQPVVREPMQVAQLDALLGFEVGADLLAQIGARATRLEPYSKAPKARESTSTYDEDRAMVRGQWVKGYAPRNEDQAEEAFALNLRLLRTSDVKLYAKLVDALASSRELLVTVLLDPHFKGAESWRWVDNVLAPIVHEAGWNVDEPERFQGLLRFASSSLLDSAFVKHPEVRRAVAELWPPIEARVLEHAKAAKPRSTESQRAGLQKWRLARWEHHLKLLTPSARETLHASLGLDADARKRILENPMTLL
jgi:hypothetical protein